MSDADRHRGGAGPTAGVAAGGARESTRPSGLPSGWFAGIGSGVVLLAAVTAVYANALRADLVLDARPLILDNPAVHTVSASNLWTILTSPYWHPFANDGLYRPLTTLTYLFNYAVLGGREHGFGYHAVNLALHLANVALVWALVWTVVGRAAPAFLAAAIFGVHPVTTEAVTNVVGRADLLATGFVVGGLSCHIRAAAAVGERRMWWQGGVVACGLLGALAKESGLVLLPVILLYEATLGPRDRAVESRREVVGECVALVVVTAAVLAIRWWVAQNGELSDEPSPIDNPIVEAGFWSGGLTGLKVVAYQLALLLWPATLSADYSDAQIPVVRFPPASFGDALPAVALVAVTALVWTALRARTRRPALAFFLLLGVVTLLPTANIFVVIGSIMAERFLYMPLVGFAAATACVVAPLLEASSRARVAVFVAIAAVLVAYGWRTIDRNQDWQTEAILAERTVATAPLSAKAHRGWAVVLFEQDTTRVRLPEVIGHAERAVAIRPDYLQALLDAGQYHLVAADVARDRGEDPRPSFEKAASFLERAREVDVATDRRYGERMVAVGRAGSGIPHIGHLELYERLATAYQALGRTDDQVAALRAARDLRPVDANRYVEIASALSSVDDWHAAARALFQAMAIDPNNQKAGERLVLLYRYYDRNGGEIVADTGNRATLDLDQPTVHRQRCDAYAELIEIFIRANLPSSADAARGLVARECATK